MISQVPQVGPYQQFSSPPRQMYSNAQMPGPFPLAQTIQPQPQFIPQQQMFQGGMPFQHSIQQQPMQMPPPQFQQQPIQAMSPVKLAKEEPKKEGKKGWWNCFSYDEEPEHKKKKIVGVPQQVSPKHPPQQIQQPMLPLEYQQQQQFIQYPQFQPQQMPFQPMMMSNPGGIQYISGQPLQYQQMQQLPMQQQYQYEEYSAEKKKKKKHGKSKDQKGQEKKDKQ